MKLSHLKWLIIGVLVCSLAVTGRALTAAGVTAPQGCRGGDPLAKVYQPWRLIVLHPCLAATGVIQRIDTEPDGDLHVDISLDVPFRFMLNAINISSYSGYLVTEVVPADQSSVQVPAVGTHVRIVGPWVHDLNHGHNEIHPVWLMQPTSQVGTAPKLMSLAATRPVACGRRSNVDANADANAMHKDVLPLVLAVCPTPVTDYLEATLTAYTRPGASCRGWVIDARGQATTDPRLQIASRAGNDDAVSWWWIPQASVPGRATATVVCRIGHISQHRTLAFTIAPGQRPKD